MKQQNPEDILSLRETCLSKDQNFLLDIRPDRRNKKEYETENPQTTNWNKHTGPGCLYFWLCICLCDEDKISSFAFHERSKNIHSETIIFLIREGGLYPYRANRATFYFVELVWGPEKEWNQRRIHIHRILDLVKSSISFSVARKLIILCK